MKEKRRRQPADNLGPRGKKAGTPVQKAGEAGPSGTPPQIPGMDTDLSPDGADETGNSGAARFRALFDCLPGGACMVKASGSGALLSDYRVTDINAAALRMSKKERGDIIGRPMNELPVMDGIAMAVLLQCVLHSQGSGETVHTSRQAGVTLRIRAFRLGKDELGILFDDVTEQETVKRRLVECERKYRDIEGNLTDVVWQSDPQGISIGGWGLSLTPRQMAKFGYLYLNRGVWEGQALVPAAWVEQSTQVQAPFEAGADLRYGYHWWRVPTLSERTFAAIGLYGQFILVIPELDAVIVFASTVENVDIPQLVVQRLLPAFQSDESLPPNPAAYAELQAWLAEIAQP